ncbi:hypothetical protein EI94DRAFT_1787885 [Lactarius quietus]|nr:hypothetical protein EI94DRAFT_1787885 [Lactarius quietus]
MPCMALTVGVKTVLESRDVVVVVTGQRKALTLNTPLSMIVGDEDATSGITSRKNCQIRQIVHEEVEKSAVIGGGRNGKVVTRPSGPSLFGDALKDIDIDMEECVDSDDDVDLLEECESPDGAFRGGSRASVLPTLLLISLRHSPG